MEVKGNYGGPPFPFGIRADLSAVRKQRPLCTALYVLTLHIVHIHESSRLRAVLFSWLQSRRHLLPFTGKNEPGILLDVSLYIWKCRRDPSVVTSISLFVITALSRMSRTRVSTLRPNHFLYYKATYQLILDPCVLRHHL